MRVGAHFVGERRAVGAHQADAFDAQVVHLPARGALLHLVLDGDVPRPSGGAAIPRYLRFNYVVANAFTAGAVTAGIILGRDDLPAYPAGIAVAN